MVIQRCSLHIFDLLKAKSVFNQLFTEARCSPTCDKRVNPLHNYEIIQSITTSVQHNSSLQGFRAKTKEYTGRKLVGFSMEQMYDVVADVKQYKSFLPFCKKSDVLIEEAEFLKAKLVIGFPPITESYTSCVTLRKPRLVKGIRKQSSYRFKNWTESSHDRLLLHMWCVCTGQERAECSDGTLFDHLTTTWQFSPGLKSQAQTCVIDFYVSFKFKSSFHSHLAHLFFNELVRQMEGAFFDEARRRYGPPIIHTLKLEKPKS